MNAPHEKHIPLNEPQIQSTSRKLSLLSAQQNPILLDDKQPNHSIENNHRDSSYKIDIVTNPTDEHLFSKTIDIHPVKLETFEHNQHGNRLNKLGSQRDASVEITMNENGENDTPNNNEESSLSRNNSIRRRQKNEKDPNVETVL